MINRRNLILGGVAMAGGLLPATTHAERKMTWGGSGLIVTNVVDILDAMGLFGEERQVFIQKFDEFAANSDVSPANVGSHCPNVNEWAFVNEINQYRAANNRGPLQMSRSLAAAARHHAYYMSRSDDIDHSLGSVSWSTNIDNYGYPEEFHIGENVLAGRQSAGGALALWKTSGTHNQNMLDSDWIRIGVGRVYHSAGRYDFYWCTTFGSGSHRTISSC